jgi:hypothetical protein
MTAANFRSGSWRINGTYVRDSLDANRLELVCYWQSESDNGWEPVRLHFAHHEELRQFVLDVQRYARRYGVLPGQRNRNTSQQPPKRRKP